MEISYRNIVDLDGLAIMLTFSTLVIVIAKYYNNLRFYSFLSLPLNNKYVAIYGKKGRLTSSFHFLFFLFQLINSSVFILITSIVFNKSNWNNNMTLLLSIVLGLFLFLGAKIILQISVGYVFEITEFVSELIFSKQSYYNHSGLLIFLGNIIALYVFPYSKIVLILSFLLFLMINVIGIVNVLRSNQNAFKSKPLYFILYLCALEIAPLVLIGTYIIQ